jgi:hypothetical protein
MNPQSTRKGTPNQRENQTLVARILSEDSAGRQYPIQEVALPKGSIQEAKKYLAKHPELPAAPLLEILASWLKAGINPNNPQGTTR